VGDVKITSAEAIRRAREILERAEQLRDAAAVEEAKRTREPEDE
jgi:hypothetical protein